MPVERVSLQKNGQILSLTCAGPIEGCLTALRQSLGWIFSCAALMSNVCGVAKVRSKDEPSFRGAGFWTSTDC